MTPASEPQRAAYVEQVMGLPVSIHVRGPEPRSEEVAAAVTDAFALLHHVDELFSTYRPDSEVSRIDSGELLVDDAHPWVREVCDQAESFCKATNGLFDVRLPGRDGVHRFDPSGIVKGWAAERAATLLDGLHGIDYCLNAGGDVVVGGRAVGTRPWRVGIEAPGRPGLLGFVERTAGAVATSGSAARGDHVVDPRTGSAPTALLSATVSGPSLMQADVLATAAFVRGEDAVAWVERFPGYRALLVRRDGAVLGSAGFGLHPLAPPAVAVSGR